MMFLFFAQVFAATLSEYKEAVAHLKDDAAAIIAGGMGGKEQEDYEREFFGEIRELLPAKDRIEWEGASLETDNQWIFDKIEHLATEKNPSRREEIFTEIYERLAAIEQKIAELEKAAAAERTKDENKQKLAEILRREEYRKPEERGESFLQRIYREFTEWLKKNFPRLNIPESSSGGFESVSFILQLLLYALVLGIIGFLIYRFMPFFAGKFRGRESREKRDRVILGEKVSAREDARSLFDEAERLAREGNTRQAIRKGYISLLCELSDRKIVRLAQHKTNRDYLRDVRKRDELFRDMRGLTNNYERHWYGFDEASETDWEEFRAGYREAVGKAR